MDDFDEYDDTDFSQAELVEMAMGNPIGEDGLAMKTNTHRLTKAQAGLICEALSETDFENDFEIEVAQRTQTLLMESFDLE